MEIIKKGVELKETKSYKRSMTKYIKKCRDCGCVFVYKRTEINSCSVDWNYVICPHCQCCNDVIFKRRYREKGAKKDE